MKPTLAENGKTEEDAKPEESKSVTFIYSDFVGFSLRSAKFVAAVEPLLADRPTCFFLWGLDKTPIIEIEIINSR